MAAGKLIWDEPEDKLYETGIQNMILFPMNNDGTYGEGVAWNGITAFNENPSGAEATKQYADNTVYAVLISPEQFGATLEAYQSPEEFDECDGTVSVGKGLTIAQQTRKGFALAYRTEIGSDANAGLGYKWHFVYGCKAAPSSRSHQTINESPQMDTLSWEITTTPVAVAGHKPTAHIVVNSVLVDDNDKMTSLETILFGQDADAEKSITATASRLPKPEELIAMFPASVG